MNQIKTLQHDNGIALNGKCLFVCEHHTLSYIKIFVESTMIEIEMRIVASTQKIKIRIRKMKINTMEEKEIMSCHIIHQILLY